MFYYTLNLVIKQVSKQSIVTFRVIYGTLIKKEKLVNGKNALMPIMD